MQKNKFNPYRHLENRLMFVILLLVVPVYVASGQAQPDVPTEYRQYFAKYEDNRSFLESSLNLLGIGNPDMGRSFALIAGVSYYPNMSPLNQQLKPAEEDLRKLVEYLKKYEFFDEIVVLKNQDMNTENFRFFLQSYFPSRLEQFPKSRFMFAYSGHGMTEGQNGYLLENTAINLSDKANGINMRVLRVYMDEVVSRGHHVLALINSCYSGAFTGPRQFGGPDLPEMVKAAIPLQRGAHAIMAGGSDQPAWADPRVGTGSVFFEKVFAGLDGRADLIENGVITVHELVTYLIDEVKIATNQKQTPILGDLVTSQSQGEFFFLNRERQIQEGVVEPWDPDNVTAFGVETATILEQAKEDYRSGNFSSAVPGFREAAQRGNEESMVYLGYMYDKGLGVSQDYSEAIYWYRKGAEAGYGLGMNNLGVMYREGQGVLQDYETALYWFQKGAEADNALAMTNLGHFYGNGYGTSQDYSEAVYWYRKGAEAGSAVGMRNLGVMYRDGLGVPQNYAMAIEWYRKAIEAGDAAASGHLGDMYDEGYGVAENDVEAVRLYRQGAEAGDDYSMGMLGHKLQTGTGVTQNYIQAFDWYRKGAEAGDNYSMGQVGYMYMNGYGVDLDYQQAIYWLRKGAEANDSVSMSNLGYLYENGYGTAKDYDEAIRWYRKAAREGNEWARNRLTDLGESYY